jgi:hypothetical protein
MVFGRYCRTAGKNSFVIDLTLLRLLSVLLVLPSGRGQRMLPLIGTRRSVQNAVVLCRTGHYCHPLPPSRIVLKIVRVRPCILTLRIRSVVMRLAFHCIQRISKIGEVVRFKPSLTLRTTNTSRRCIRRSSPWSLVLARIRAPGPGPLLPSTAFPCRQARPYDIQCMQYCQSLFCLSDRRFGSLKKSRRRHKCSTHLYEVPSEFRLH